MRRLDSILIAAVVGILVILVVPLPTFALDLLLSLSISFSLVTLLVTLACKEPLEFSTFPSLLLFGTLFRLSLNVASTRLILLRGHAGGVIDSFGNFVAGGDLVVGMIVFAILVIVQFIVITKGAGRISEVAARFTLDAMPGKQMAIDADLNAGVITESDARTRRETIAREAEFYGAMDGASKFVRGDAIATLIITVVNLVGGLIFGLKGGLGLAEAMQKYSILTIGDGLVSQIPALLTSMAAGILVTKASSKSVLSADIGQQFVRKPGSLGFASVILLLLGALPGMPTIPFLSLGAALGGLWFSLSRGNARADAEATTKPAEDPTTPEAANEIESLLSIDRLGLEIGFGLVGLVDPKRGGTLIPQVNALRRQFASTLGLVVPLIRVRDNLQLDPQGYRVLLEGQEIAKGSLMPGYRLAIPSAPDLEPLPGVQTTDPTFGLKATWIREDKVPDAEILGYTVVDPVAVLITHLGEVLRSHAAEILSRDDVQELLDHVKERSPAAANELVPNLLTLGQLQKVLQNLLRERVGIRNLPAILEVLADEAGTNRNPEQLTEVVRQRLARTIVAAHVDADEVLAVLDVDPDLERGIAELVTSAEARSAPTAPAIATRFVDAVAAAHREAAARGIEPVLVVRSPIRRAVAEMVATAVPRCAVLSYNEIAIVKKIDTVGTVSASSTEARMATAST
ncbi:MAG: flagellar biosynthesis protein FlhA [Planctomycetes bacterium]|nr:flagellar biosynthesis protein FlhA [Planctomycetota bacterium]